MVCHVVDMHLQDRKILVSSACCLQFVGRAIFGGILVAVCAASARADPRIDEFDVSTTHQTMDNFGASDCWLAQAVGGWTNTAQKQAIADLLFSTASGIGLSCWRFNLGGGIDSTITDSLRTAETFETAQNTYDWSRQAEERWFLEAAKARDVPQFLAFVNSPPARMTRNGHTYCPDDSGTTNLQSGYEQQYAKYLVDILKHFRDNTDTAQQISFDYVSPVNEPQWRWKDPSQEGNRASNDDIKSWIQAIHAELNNQGVDTQIRVPESGEISDLYGGRDFVDDFAGDSTVNTKIGKTISYHSYWSDDPATELIQQRQALATKMAEYPDWKVWMTEYCILGDSGPGRDLTMNTALNVARVIHYDLSEANAAAWQWWLAMSSYDYKDGLIYVDLDNEAFFASKTLWALGNYSRFIRPGAKRIDFAGNNGNVNGLLASAYRDDTTQKITLVYVNMTAGNVDVQPTFYNTTGYQLDYLTPYVTSDTPGDNLKQYAPFLVGLTYTVPARSVVTLLSGTFNENNDGKVFAALTGSVSYILGSGVLTIDPGEGTYSGSLAGGGGIRKCGSGTTILTGSNTFTGPIYVSGGTLGLAGPNGSTLSPSVFINGGRLLLDNLSYNHSQRLGGYPIVTMQGGELQLKGHSTGTSENIDNLVLDHSYSTITVIPKDNVSDITALSLLRNAGATALVRGANLGSGNSGEVGQILISAPPYLSNNGSGSQAGIYPYLVGSSNDNGSGSDLVTYGNNGLRPLNSSEYVPSLAAGRNVKLTSSPAPANSVNIRCLVLNNYGTPVQVAINDGNTLTISSGAILSIGDIPVPNSIVGGSLTFGNNFATGYEGIVHVINDMSIQSVIANNGSNVVSLTKSGGGLLTLNGANTYTGETILSGGTLRIGHSSALGATDMGTTIAHLAALDLNGFSLGDEQITVQGSGLGGEGAIVNSGNGQNYALRFVTMNNDTTFGGAGRWDIRTDDPITSPASLTGNGYNLTKVGNNSIFLVNLGDTALGDINVTGGGLGIQGTTTLGDPSKTVTIGTDAHLTMWGLPSTNILEKKITLHGGTLQTSSGAGTTNTFGGEITLVPDLDGNGGILNTSADTAMTITGDIAGTGDLSKIESGTAILSGSINYSGDTIVNGGTLKIAGGIQPNGTSLIDIQSGTAILETVDISKTTLGILTADSAAFEVSSGAHEVGVIDGGGITQVQSGASLTVSSIWQDTLTIGSGAKVVIRPISGGPLSGTLTAVPEPSALVLLVGAVILLALGWVRKVP